MTRSMETSNDTVEQTKIETLLVEMKEPGKSVKQRSKLSCGKLLSSRVLELSLFVDLAQRHPVLDPCGHGQQSTFLRD